MRLLNALLLVLTLALVGGYTWWSQNSQPAAPQIAQAETAALPLAPDFAFNGSTLYALKGNVVLLNFWASWCAPCQTEFPQFVKLTQTYSNVVLLAVSVDHDKAAMQRFLDGQHIADNPQVIIVHDPAKAIAQDIFSSIRYPETLLLSPDMHLVRKYVGLEEDWAGENFAKVLASLGARRR